MDWVKLLAVLIISLKVSLGECLLYEGVRSLGMGGVYTTTLNDETALFTQPAGLSRLRQPIFSAFDIEIHGSYMWDLLRISNLTDMISFQGRLDLLNRNPNRVFYTQIRSNPSLVFPGVGLGAIFNHAFEGYLDGANDLYHARYQQDIGVSFGQSLKFFGGIMNVGVSGQLINRTEIIDEFDTTETGLKVDDLASEGMALGVTAGLTLTIPVAYLPTLSVVQRNIGRTSFTFGEGFFRQTLEKPESLAPETDVGFGITVIHSQEIRSVWVAEVRGAETFSEANNYRRRLHLGSEINLNDFIYLRFGAYQMRWTAGLEIVGDFLQYQLATYEKYVYFPQNSGSGIHHRDRRWAFKGTFRF